MIVSVHRCCQRGNAIEGTPLDARVDPETADNLNSDSTRRLTFDMSGGARGAKRPLPRPLDGVVMRLHSGNAVLHMRSFPTVAYQA